MNKLLKLLKPRPNLIGLDLGNSSVKIIELSGEDIGALKLVNYAIEPIPRELVGENGKFNDIEKVAEIIKKCWKKAGSKIKNVALALPGGATTHKKVIIPHIESENELQAQMENELTNILPDGVDVSDMAFDFYNLGVNEQNPTDDEVLIVAAKKETIDERLAVVEAAGLIPLVLDIEQYSYQNIVRLIKGEDFNNGVYVVVDCSASVQRIMVFKNGELIYTKDSPIGGFNFTQEISITYGCTIEEAEKLKVEKSDDEAFKALEKQFAMNYASEFIRSLSYFTSATSIYSIDEIIVVGGVSGMYGLVESINQSLSEMQDIILASPVYVAKPFDSIEKSSQISLTKFTKDEPSLFLALSLALRRYLRTY